MPCAPTDEFTVDLRPDLRGFKNLGGLVGIIGVICAIVPGAGIGGLSERAFRDFEKDTRTAGYVKNSNVGDG
jgi:hypothetical protein